jgi:hypothetical protein
MKNITAPASNYVIGFRVAKIISFWRRIRSKINTVLSYCLDRLYIFRSTKRCGALLASISVDVGRRLLQAASSSLGNVTGIKIVAICSPSMNFRASYVSVLTIVAFSTERYLAICYPLYLHTMSGLKRAIRIIACLWLVAFFSALPFSLYTQVDYLSYPPNSTNILLVLSRI